MEIEKAVLGPVDYTLFAIMLMISAGVGLYFRFSGGKQKTTEEYLLAGKDMGIVPVAFSLMASFLSAITMLGIPAEMYRFGINMAYMNISHVVGVLICSWLFLPVFFELQASTAYEYLERRFGKSARTLTSVVFVCQMILYMSVVLYAPALALSAVTNLSVWVSIVSIGVVCTFYCTLGGMKAVLWTDVFQATLMFIGIFAALIKGFMDVGFENVFRIASEGGRLDSPGFALDPTIRYTQWGVFAQGLIFAMSSFGGNQVQVQRLLTVKNLSRARKAVYLNIPMAAGFHFVNCLVGIVLYAYFANCDPISSKDIHISTADQLLPYFMMTALGQYSGLPGLCICGVFSASLSTVSSAVNSLTAVTMQDLIKPFLVSRGLSQKTLAFTAKAITLFYGCLCIALTFVVANFGNLIQAGLTVFGMLGGPVLAVFCLGMLTRTANEKGAVIGLVGGVCLSAWISFGASANAPPPIDLPVSLEGCASNSSVLDFFNTTTLAPIDIPSETSLLNSTFLSEIDTSDDYIFPLYKLSWMWFGPIGFGFALLLGYISSFIINLITGETKEVPEELLSPVVQRSSHKTSKTEKSDKKDIQISGPIFFVSESKKSNIVLNGWKSKEDERF